jgi:hypothetical protein
MDKQNEVLKFLLTVESATIDEIYAEMTFGYYHNYKKHLGALLSRMVQNGKIVREKKGLFRVAKTGESQAKIQENPNQIKLL